jgi:sodium/hydrogen exchanger 10/11
MIIGICWGIAACYSNWMANIMAVAHLSVLNIRYVYFPVIIFMTAFCLDVHAFFKSLPQILIISIPICFLSVSICGMLMRLVIDTKWSFIDALLFGAMSSCIYPLEVVRCLKETSIQTKHVTILLEGETLVSACLSLFFFRQLCMYYTSWAVHWYQIVMSLVREIFGGKLRHRQVKCQMNSVKFQIFNDNVSGIFTGYLFGLFGVFMMKFSYNEATTLMLLTIVMCYSSYFFIDWFMKAGTVGCAVVGIMMGIERASLSKEIEKSVTGLWMVISYIMNGIFFLIIGAIAPTYLKNHFRFSDYILIFVNYLMANMTRFLSFFLFSPILSRLGYGMSFTNMVICVWGGLKNPISINQGLFLSQAQLLEGEELFKIRLFVMHNIALYILLIFINGSLVPTLLKVLGLSEISISRQFNMNNCMKYIYEARARTIAILKMDRFLSDANWPLVLHTTALKHPYKKTAAIGNIQNNEEEEEEHILGYRFTFCPDCQKEVLNEPTPKETKEMTKEAKLRILKLKKTSYSRQFENGMISKEGIRIMHQAVEIAMDSEDLVIELDGLFKLFDKEGCFYRCLRNRIQHLIKNKTDRIKPPRKPWRLWCYRVVTHNVFSICMNVVVLFNMIQVVYHVGTATKRKKFYMTYYLMVTCNLFFFTLYLIEFWLKVFAYSWIYICKHGIPTYFKSYWNILEFIILSYSFVCLVVNIVRWVITPLTELYYFDTTLNLLLALRICKVLTHCKFYDAWKALPAVILKYLNAKVDRHRALAYELGKSYIAGEEEILENIHQTVDNDKIREVIKTKIETDRLAVTKRLGIAQKESPCVATTVKTKLAMRTVLNSMKDDIYELKVSGRCPLF